MNRGLRRSGEESQNLVAQRGGHSAQGLQVDTLWRRPRPNHLEYGLATLGDDNALPRRSAIDQFAQARLGFSFAQVTKYLVISGAGICNAAVRCRPTRRAMVRGCTIDAHGWSAGDSKWDAACKHELCSFH